MAKRPYVVFKEIKERIWIVDVLEVLGLTERFKKSGDGLAGVCPLPDHKHGPMPNPEQFKVGHKDGVDVWHCFGDCQRGGDVIEFVKAMTGYDNSHVRLWFAERFSDRLSLGKPNGWPTELAPLQTAPKPTPELRPAVLTVPPTASSESEPIKKLSFYLQLDPNSEYLRRRGVEPATIERFGLGLCKKGMLAGYVAIPIHNFPSGELIGYLGRWPGEDYDETAGRPRYRWPKDFPAHRVIYGLKQALEGTEELPLIIVEGPFKLFHLFQNGFHNVVSTFTASLSEEQATILAATGRPIILFFDGNEAGYKGMRAAAGKLISRAFVRVVKMPEGKEPDDCSRKELMNLLQF